MSTGATRSTAWRWWVCGLLLLATTINYMDRMTLSSASKRIIDEFQLSKENYGELEMWFAIAFATGAIVFGTIADRTSIRWLYPGALLAWSVMGALTGFVYSFIGLLACRTLLGFFEAGHWPCALTTTQRLLPPHQRTLGNSLLQSGTSIGAIITPLVMNALLTDEPGSWRFPFQLIGTIGIAWVALWLMSVQTPDLALPADASKLILDREPLTTTRLICRLAVLVTVVVCINACWHLFRVWMVLFLQEGRGYSERDALLFTSVYYVATDVGCLLAGVASLGLHRAGLSVMRARWGVFFVCSLCTMLSVPIAYEPSGPLLQGMLLLLGARALGLFPCYYALSQEITARHQGKLSGTLGMVAWASAAPMHKFFGRLIDETGSYDLGLAIAGCLPMFACIVWAVLWNRGAPASRAA